MSNTQVAEKKTTAVANIMADFEAHSGAGMDQIGAEDMQIPFLRVLQPMSPQLNEQEPVYIEDASAGDLYNSVTGQFWKRKEGVYVIPFGYTVKYLEFLPKDPGSSSKGGMVGELNANDPDIHRTTRNGAVEILPSGNELIRSHQHLVVVVDPKTGASHTAICDLKKTGIKVSKRWNTMMRMVQYEGKNGPFNPPMWGTVWKVTGVQESNDYGSWFNLSVDRVDPTDVPANAIQEAKNMFESFQKGEVKTSAGTADEMGVATPTTDDVPF